ncbi:MAG: CHASE3 domain-containing protein [Alphaproteobacteria bacterium]|nr:CHASE3 domain-containing protein [Alphaproteobacteria bacterium]
MNNEEPDKYPELKDSLQSKAALTILGTKSISFAFLALLSVLAITFYMNREADRSQEWVSHSQQVQKALAEVLSLLQDTETGQRGYLLTNDTKYLEPFDSAVKRVEIELSVLKNMIGDNQSHQEKMVNLEFLIEKKIRELQDTILLNQSVGFESALKIVKTDIGKNIMDKIRVVIEKMSVEEIEVFKQRQKKFKEIRNFSITAYFLAITMVIGIFLVVIIRIQDFISYRQKMDFFLQDAIKKAEIANKELKINEERYRDLYDNAPDIYCSVGAKTAKILQCNDTFTSVLGFSKEEVIGRPISDFYHPESIEIARTCLNRFVETGSARSDDLMVKRKDGSFLNVSLRVSAVRNENGEIVSSRSIWRDITEQTQMEKALIAAKDKAEEANRAKSKFLSSMSHELRTPLNAILGFTQILKTDTRQKLTQTQDTAVDHVLKAGDHLLTLIDDILDLAAIEAGQDLTNIATLDPTPLIENCTAIAENLANQSDITFYDRTRTWVLPMITVDETRFCQTLLNLLSNAVKYNRQQGTITLSVEERENTHIRFSVTDTGHGIAEEQQSHIFKPFSRLGLENSDIAGTGIGLVITKELVENMGGNIGFTSQLGAGSTFWVEFPIVSGGLVEKARNLRVVKASASR